MLRTDIPKVAACLLYTLGHGLFTFTHPDTRIIVLYIKSISERIASPADLPSCSAYRRPRGYQSGSGDNPSFSAQSPTLLTLNAGQTNAESHGSIP